MYACVHYIFAALESWPECLVGSERFFVLWRKAVVKGFGIDCSWHGTVRRLQQLDMQRYKRLSIKRSTKSILMLAEASVVTKFIHVNYACLVALYDEMRVILLQRNLGSAQTGYVFVSGISAFPRILLGKALKTNGILIVGEFRFKISTNVRHNKTKFKLKPEWLVWSS